jgi:cytoskeletal protein RodZ
MVLSRVLAVGLWLAVTVASTAMVWAATSIVAADVTDRPPAVVAHEDVVSELASGSTVPTAPPTTTTTLRPAGTTTTVAARGQAPAGPATTVARQSPLVTAPPVTSPPTPTTLPRAPATPTTPAPARPTATYATVGGVVRVACNGLLIELVSAIPNNGYSVKVPVNGPANVEVHFVKGGQDVEVKAVCFGEPIRYSDPTPPSRGFGGF